MLRYQISILPAALKQLAVFPLLDQKRIAAKIDGLAMEPQPPGSQKLKDQANLYRLRSGDYRAIYQIQPMNLVVVVIKIGHRREIYR